MITHFEAVSMIVAIILFLQINLRPPCYPWDIEPSKVQPPPKYFIDKITNLHNYTHTSQESEVKFAYGAREGTCVHVSIVACRSICIYVVSLLKVGDPAAH